MIQYKTRIEEIEKNFNAAVETKAEARSIEPAPDTYDTILDTFAKAKRMRSKAARDLSKLASELGFKLLKEIKDDDDDFLAVLYSIKRRINAAIEALYGFEQRYELNIATI